MGSDLSPKENYLEAIRFGRPQYVPLWTEEITKTFSFDGLIRMETWTDRWGVGWVTELDHTVPFPKGNPLADIQKVYEYPFPDPDTLSMSQQTLSELGSTDRGRFLSIGSMTYLNFERAWALMGMENFLVSMIEFPVEAAFLVERIADYAKGVFCRYLEMGMDGVSFSEDLGSQKALMMSPELFRKFFLPAYTHCLSDVLSAGKIVNFHSCGCVNEIAGDLADLGITILNPIQARANDLGKIKDMTFGRTALSGGIDTDLILRGTPLQVYQETERVLSILKPGGGYICGPDQSFPWFPPENIDAMERAWADHRYY